MNYVRFVGNARAAQPYPSAFLSEGLLDDENDRTASPRRWSSRTAAAFAMAGVIAGACLSTAFTAAATPASATTTGVIPETPAVTLFGPSGEIPGYEVSRQAQPDQVRAKIKDFVATLSDDIKGHVYYPDPALQRKQWQICTIVQQCLSPDYGKSIAELTPHSRTKFFLILAFMLSDESYKRIVTQHLSNLLLGEMQTWAVSCPGKCAEMTDPKGLLPDNLIAKRGKLDVNYVQMIGGVDATYDECAALRYAGRFTLWECDDSPKMIHHGNMDTQTGRYFLGNVFDEPAIHGRNNHYDFVAVYGSLEPGEPFGFRYSGHHFDLSISIDEHGAISDLPTFMGHNPLVVARTFPPGAENAVKYLNWHNMAGIPQFPDAVHEMLGAASVLTNASYVPLGEFLSTPATGGLTLSGGRQIGDVPHLELSKASDEVFNEIWDVIDYTLEFPRGARPRPEKALFREQGKMLWTTVMTGDDPLSHLPRTHEDMSASRMFFYVRVETDDLLFFMLVNSLFSLMLETEPSNHLHSILIPKAYLQDVKG